MTDLAILGIGVDATQVVAGTNALAGLTSAGDNAENSMQALTQASGLLSKGLAALGIVSVTAAIVDLAKESTELAAKYQTLGLVMNVTGANAGYSAAQMEAAAKAIESASYTMTEGREYATKLAYAHIDIANAGKLAATAQNLAAASGMDENSAMEALITSTETGMSRQLRHMGIVVDFTKAQKEYADKLGITADSLTEEQKAEVNTQEVIAKSSSVAGAFAESLKTVSGQLREAKQDWENLKTEIGDNSLGLAKNQADLLRGSINSLKGVAEELGRSNSIKLFGKTAVFVLGSVEIVAIDLINTLAQVARFITYMSKAKEQFLNGDFAGSKKTVDEFTKSYDVAQKSTEKLINGILSAQDAMEKQNSSGAKNAQTAAKQTEAQKNHALALQLVTDTLANYDENSNEINDIEKRKKLIIDDITKGYISQAEAQKALNALNKEETKIKEKNEDKDYKKQIEEEKDAIKSATDKINIDARQIQREDELNKQILAGSISYDEATKQLNKNTEAEKLRELASRASSKAIRDELNVLANKLDLEAKQKKSTDNTNAILAEQDATDKANASLQKEIDLYYESADAKIVDLAAYKAEIEAKGKDATNIDEIIKKTRQQTQEQIDLNKQKQIAAALDNRTKDEGESTALSALGVAVNGNQTALGMIGKSAEQLKYEDAKKWIDKNKALIDRQVADYNKANGTQLSSTQVTETAIANLKKASLDSQLQATADFFGQMSSLSSSKNKELQAIGKASAIAQATINGYVAVSNALAVEPWWLGMTQAVVAGTMAAANVAKIMGMAEGGAVQGPGGPTEDRVPAMLSNGEFVINAVAASRNRPLLEAINTNAPTLQRPVYAASGGSVSTSIPSVGSPNVTIHNYTGASVSTSIDDTGALKIMIQKEAKRQAENVLHSELSNPNSKSRKLLKQGTNLQDRHSA